MAGRARFSIAGLRRSHDLKHRLETRLAGGAIVHVSASTTTGNILVTFDPEVDAEAIRRRICEWLQAPDETERIEDGEAWYGLDAGEVLRRLDSAPTGLTEQEARERLACAGANVIAPVQGRSAREMLLAQVQSLPVGLLGAGALLSLLTGGLVDALVILGVIAANAAIGFAAESKSERTINALSDDSELSGAVWRDGSLRDVPARDIVPGDMIALSAGAIVPADARLVEADTLAVSEAALTGESLPVAKTVATLARDRMPLAERRNMLFRGTLVTGGSGRAVVVATGAHSQLGQIQASIGTLDRPQTPMQRQLDRLGQQLVLLSLGACGLLFTFGLLRGQGLVPMLKTTVSLAVAAVPEGLPTLATTTLALGIEDLRRRGVLIRRLPAVEGLSAVQLICFDKTGTLTQNRMAVVCIATTTQRYRTDGPAPRITTAADPDLIRLLELCALCNDSTLADDGPRGSSTETALLQAAADAGLDIEAIRARAPRLSASQRAEGRRYMATVHAFGDGRRLTAVKGNPDEVLALCRRQLVNGRPRPMRATERRHIRAQNQELAASGLRVLGVAYGENDDDLSENLVWVGLIAMADPVRADAAAIIGSFHRAGIGTLMITGDQPATAAAVARALNIGLVDGKPGGQIFSRVTPAEKLRIVRELQAKGQVVAMTGDGVNDAPSLRAADIGIALGGGTDAARQTADVILLGDELQGIVVAIERGRATYDNIRRAIHYLLATNLSEILLMLGVTATGIGQPLTPVQLLWLNLVTDVLPAIGLALEPPEGDVMRHPPRQPSESIVAPDGYRRLGRDAAAMAGSALLAQLYAASRRSANARSGTVGFAGLVSAQLLYALRCRARRDQAAAQPRRLGPALALAFAAQGLALFAPGLRRLCGGPIGLTDAAVALGAGALPLLIPRGDQREEKIRSAP